MNKSTIKEWWFVGVWFFKKLFSKEVTPSGYGRFWICTIGNDGWCLVRRVIGTFCC